jgi:RimJ/RimL family protein N-acetyltransferase
MAETGMNWNFETEHFFIRLPISDQDGDALYGLLKNPQTSAHLPRLPMFASVQSLDELRRATLRFQAREAAVWLVESRSDNIDEMAELKARFTLQNINWMLQSGRLQWELAASLTQPQFAEILAAIEHFCFAELGLHRLEVRMLPDAQPHADWLQTLGYIHEGCLPAQLEYEGEWVDQALYSRLATDLT